MPDTNQITKEQLGGIAKELFDLLEAQPKPLDLDAMLDQSFPATGAAHIFVELRLSQKNTSAYTISYIVPGLGIPLEVKVNRTLMWSMLIIKADLAPAGYQTFSSDSFGNPMHYKQLDSIDISEISRELNVLAQLAQK